MKFNSRIPIIALPYADRHKAVPKELLIDYDTGNIYVVSATDKSIIFDITSKILEKIENISGNNIVINIDGIGDVNLTEVISKIMVDMEDMVIIDDEGKSDIYIPKEERLDNISMESRYKRIQLLHFEKAENGMIPQKFNGKLRWIFPPQYDDGMNPPGGGTPGTPNPDDGLSTKVHLIEPVEGKIFLRASRRQRTVNLARDVRIILPRILDEFSEIFWCMRTYSYDPRLTFEDRVLFNSINQAEANSYHIFKFTTWDSGETWFGELERYSKDPETDIPDDIVVDINYLQKNYYSKEYINSNYLNNIELNKQLERDYFGKVEVEEMLSWMRTGSLPQIKLPKYMLEKK